MRDNDKIIRYAKEDEDYVETDQQQEILEDDEPAQYQEKFVKNEITYDEERQILDDVQSEY